MPFFRNFSAFLFIFWDDNVNISLASLTASLTLPAAKQDI